MSKAIVASDNKKNPIVNTIAKRIPGTVSKMESDTLKGLNRRLSYMTVDFMDIAEAAVDIDADEEGFDNNVITFNHQATESMLFAAYSPYFDHDGINLSSFFMSQAAKSIIRHLDPNFDMEVARLEEHFAETLHDMKHPKAKGLEKLFMNDSVMRSMNGFKQAVHDRNVDGLIMSPVRLAEIKVACDKQFYTRSRACHSMDEIKELQAKYDRSIGFIGNIAKRNGYDMAAVASEERYIVGLKIKEDPNYANIYNETYDMGAEPDFQYDVTDKHTRIWSGRFKTVDGGEYTVGGHVNKGSFTVRLPFGYIDTDKPQSTKIHSDIDPRKRIGEEYKIRAKEWGSIVRYLNSSNCVFSDDMRDAIKSRVNSEINDYRDRMISAMRDDNVYVSDSDGKKEWNKYFNKIYKEMVESDDVSLDMGTDRLLSSNSRIQGVDYRALDSKGNVLRGYIEDGKFNLGDVEVKNTYRNAIDDEIKRITVKDVLDKAHIKYGEGTAVDVLGVRSAIAEHYKRVFMQQNPGNTDDPRYDWRNFSDELKAISNDDDHRYEKTDTFGKIMLDRMCNERMRNMSVDEAIALLRHAVVNVDQGRMRRNGVPGRDPNADWLTNRFDYKALADGAAVEKWRENEQYKQSSLDSAKKKGDPFAAIRDVESEASDEPDEPDAVPEEEDEMYSPDND